MVRKIKNKKEIEQILEKIDQEFNLTMAKLNRLYQKKLNLIKQTTEEKDKLRLEKLRKNILNK